LVFEIRGVGVLTPTSGDFFDPDSFDSAGRSRAREEFFTPITF